MALRPDDRGLTVQQFRLAAIAAKAAQNAQRPEAGALTAQARSFYTVLQRSFPAKEMVRFNLMMAKIEPKIEPKIEQGARK